MPPLVVQRFGTSIDKGYASLNTPEYVALIEEYEQEREKKLQEML
jgi:hypothetical protein